ncbi:MAG: Mur ligase family protein [Pseudomonadales bacterium]
MNHAEPQLVIDDLRRLTGPSLLWDEPGSIIDVLVTGVPIEHVVESWQQQVRQLLDAVGWQSEASCVRVFDGGASLAISSPIDALYASCDVNEIAWQRSCLQIAGEELPDFESSVAELKKTIGEERNPNLIALQKFATEYGAAFLWDDDEVSIGHGKTVQIWPTPEAPAVEEVNWSAARHIPCALITGTNGKSTSVRVASKIAEVAGVTAGVTSTDFIRVGDHIIDEGDYSGPGGARVLLRDERTELALLEVARGGILRRGLPIESAAAALITNLAEDHLGDYGINTLAELTAVKFVVAKALGPDGILVLNADDDSIVEYSNKIDNTLCWFSLSSANHVMQQHMQQGGRVVFERDGRLIYHHNGVEEEIITVAQIPMTMNGAAKHNVANALGVVGLCKALQFSPAAIAKGLSAFHSSAKDNPGRGNQFEYRGAKVFVDFAHNEHSMNAIVDTLKSIPAKRRLLMLGHAGDRSDLEMQTLAAAAHKLGVDHWVVAELPNYLRGRESGEIPRIIAGQLQELGVAEQEIEYADSVFEGAKKALAWAQEGDSLLLLAPDDRDKIFAMLA